MKLSTSPAFDTDKFSNVHQIGGIQLAAMEPTVAGHTLATRFALVNTGCGLRFTVALDRGGDIVDAAFNQHNLAYLNDVGVRPPSHAYHHDMEWLANWPAGLLTTCGPQYVGGPRHEDNVDTAMHGHHSNCPAKLESIINPDPRHGKFDMSLTMLIRDARMFGPVLETRRVLRCNLGEPVIELDDTVTNIGNSPAAHHWLYHVNLGYPLVDQGAKLIFGGSRAIAWQRPEPRGGAPKVTAALSKKWKTVPGCLPEHAGAGERGMLFDVAADRRGVCHVGLINEKLKLGFELTYPRADLPRLVNWQHFGPMGSYVTGLEPLAGSLFGKAKDDHKMAERYLKPGQSARYRMTMRVLIGAEELSALKRFDGTVSA